MLSECIRLPRPRVTSEDTVDSGHGTDTRDRDARPPPGATMVGRNRAVRPCPRPPTGPPLAHARPSVHSRIPRTPPFLRRRHTRTHIGWSQTSITSTPASRLRRTVTNPDRSLALKSVTRTWRGGARAEAPHRTRRVRSAHACHAALTGSDHPQDALRLRGVLELIGTRELGGPWPTEHACRDALSSTAARTGGRRRGCPRGPCSPTCGRRSSRCCSRSPCCTGPSHRYNMDYGYNNGYYGYNNG